MADQSIMVKGDYRLHNKNSSTDFNIVFLRNIELNAGYQ